MKTAGELNVCFFARIGAFKRSNQQYRALGETVVGCLSTLESCFSGKEAIETNPEYLDCIKYLRQITAGVMDTIACWEAVVDSTLAGGIKSAEGKAMLIAFQKLIESIIINIRAYRNFSMPELQAAGELLVTGEERFAAIDDLRRSRSVDDVAAGAGAAGSAFFDEANRKGEEEEEWSRDRAKGVALAELDLAGV